MRDIQRQLKCACTASAFTQTKHGVQHRKQGRPRLLSSAGWSAAGALASYLASFAAISVLARLLKPEAFGSYRTLVSLIGFFGLLGGFEVRQALRQAIPASASNGKFSGAPIASAGIVSVGATLTVTILLLLGADKLATDIYRDQQIAVLLPVCVCAIWLSVAGTFAEGVLQGFEEFRVVAVWRAAPLVVTVIIQLLLTRYHLLRGAILGLSLTYLGAGFALWVLMLRSLGQRKVRDYCPDRRHLGYVLILSSGTLVAALFYPLSEWLAGIRIGRNLGFGEAGLYLAALAIVRLVNSLGGPLCAPLVPHLSGLFREGHRELAATTLRHFSKAYFLTILAIVLLVTANSRLIMKIVYGNSYLEGASLLALMAPSLVFTAITEAASKAIIADGRTWRVAGLNAGGFLVFMAAMALGAGAGSRGFGVAVLSSEVFRAVISALYLHKTFDVVPRRPYLWATGVFLCFASAYGCGRFDYAVALSLSLGLTGSAAWCVWLIGIDSAEKALLKSAVVSLFRGSSVVG